MAFALLAVLVPSVRQVDLACATIWKPPIGQGADGDACQSLLVFLMCSAAHALPFAFSLVEMFAIERPHVLRNACIDHVFLALAIASTWSILGSSLTSQYPYSLSAFAVNSDAAWWVLLALHGGLQVTAAILHQLCRALLSRCTAVRSQGLVFSFRRRSPSSSSSSVAMTVLLAALFRPSAAALHGTNSGASGPNRTRRRGASRQRFELARGPH